MIKMMQLVYAYYLVEGKLYSVNLIFNLLIFINKFIYEKIDAFCYGWSK